ncbi:MAG TPA: sugar phosphate isomerase/epimerase [Gemmatimonadaceae bacterium]|nr:sugar phosphate isomerase/epimerase [Gemmatimonadaceae bacterium]
MFSRRSFLQTLAAVSLPPALAAAARRRGATGTRLPHIGLQLYTVRDAMQRDLPGTLARVAAIGYDEVEFAGYFDHPPDRIRRVLDELHLRAPGAHVALEALEGRERARTVDAALAIGHEWLVVPWLDADVRQTADDYRRVADRLNAAGRALRERGLRVAYHNHDFELTPVDGARGLDVLLESTDPALVDFEMDIYWVVKGGGDPLDFFHRHRGRFAMVHVKDATAAPAREMMDVGSGVIDFARIFAHDEEGGVRHWFVEHDAPANPFASIRRSYEFLRRLDF